MPDKTDQEETGDTVQAKEEIQSDNEFESSAAGGGEHSESAVQDRRAEQSVGQ
jgi:hypothetical protein